MKKFFEGIFKVAEAGVVAIAVVALIAVVTALPVKWCWNAAMPDIFGLPEIGFVKAFCLVWLASSFFKASSSGRDS